MRRLAIAETVPNGRELRTLSSADAQLDFRRQLQFELTVRIDNQNAKALYERHGFSVEGLQQRSFSANTSTSTQWLC
jgi:ribosomal protein S18 acetylase RimI-like enzyme